MEIVCADGASEDWPTLEPLIGRLRARGHGFRWFDSIPPDRASWQERLAGADGLLLIARIPPGILPACPALKIVSVAGTDLARLIPLAEAREGGIAVCNVPGYGTDAVAEHAVALIFAAARNVARGDRELRRGEWCPRSGIELRGKTLGVVGLGRIGARTAEIGAALGMRVLSWSRNPESERARSAPGESVALEALFANADFVSLHIPHTAETEGMVDAELLGSMRPGAVLVNTARAELVDQEALLEALDDGPLGAAAIDVFEQEPPGPAEPLLARENVVATPHVGFYTPEAIERLFSVAIENLLAFEDGRGQNRIV
jgi:phosphoglycerate dehydrogenase-like enzyme